jgi:hypothetical protein
MTPKMKALIWIKEFNTVVEISMSASGQTEKNSVRAYVFCFALKLGHCWMHSACLKGARSGHRPDSFDHLIGAREQR